jgi:hypothetical protein
MTGSWYNKTPGELGRALCRDGVSLANQRLPNPNRGALQAQLRVAFVPFVQRATGQVRNAPAGIAHKQQKGASFDAPLCRKSGNSAVISF